MVTQPSDRIEELRRLTDRVLDLDPLAPGLAAREGRRWLRVAAADVRRDLEVCQQQPPEQRRDPALSLEEALSELPPAEPAPGRRPFATRAIPVEARLNGLLRAGRLVTQACGSTSLSSQALQLIARRHGLEEA